MWEDKILYWAWKGSDYDGSNPPTKKTISYATIHYPNWYPSPLTTQIACGVYDNERYTVLNLKEIQWHIDQNAIVTFPE